MNDAERKQIAREVAFEETVTNAYEAGSKRVKLNVKDAYAVVMKLCSLRRAQASREYYEDILIDVKVLLESAEVGGVLQEDGEPESRIPLGRPEEPSKAIQNALRELLQHKERHSRQDVIWLAMYRAIERHEDEADGTFTALDFSKTLTAIAGSEGLIQGQVIRAILAGRTDVEQVGDSLWRLLGDR